MDESGRCGGGSRPRGLALAWALTAALSTGSREGAGVPGVDRDDSAPWAVRRVGSSNRGSRGRRRRRPLAPGHSGVGAGERTADGWAPGAVGLTVGVVGERVGGEDVRDRDCLGREGGDEEGGQGGGSLQGGWPRSLPSAEWGEPEHEGPAAAVGA